jgi:hypothetical protein
MNNTEWKIGSLLRYIDEDDNLITFGIVIEERHDGRFGVQWMDGACTIEKSYQTEHENGIRLIAY